jgi:hypothetical protein
MPRFGNNVDLAKFELQNARLQNLAAAPASPVTGQEYFDTTLGHAQVYNGTAWEQASGGGGTGTVSSVALAAPSAVLGVSGSPVTSAGTLTLSLATQAANLVFAGPASGGAVAPTFRALAAADVPRLDLLTVPAAALSLNGQRITNLATPTAGTDAANKAYVDTAVQGLDQKPTAQAATTAALPANTYANGTSGVGATLTANANAALVVDGYTVLAGDRVLVKNEAAAQTTVCTLSRPPAPGRRRTSSRATWRWTRPRSSPGLSSPSRTRGRRTPIASGSAPTRPTR